MNPRMYAMPGEMRWSRWTTEHDGLAEPITHTLLVAGVRPIPYTRQTLRNKKLPIVARYNAWRERVAEQLLLTMRSHEIEPYSPREHLGLAISAGAVAAAPPNARRRKNGEVDKRTVASIRDWDANNVWKAIEDVLNGILYPDDKQVLVTGPGAFFDVAADWFAVHVWGGSSIVTYDPSWDDDSVPFGADWLTDTVHAQ